MRDGAEQISLATRAHDLRALSVVRSWRGLAELVLIVLAIAVSVLCTGLAIAEPGRWFLWPLAFLASVWAQHTVNEEIHDGVHYRLLRRHRANDALAGFYASLIGVPFGEYRGVHMLHHRRFGMPEDPDYPKYATRPRTPSGWMRYFAANFSGAAALYRLVAGSSAPGGTQARRASSVQYPLATIALQLALWGITAIVVSPFWYPLCWVLPLITLTYGMTQFRVLLEHWREPLSDDAGTGGLFNLGGAVQKHIFAAQFGYNRHGTHHLHPSVPNYNLARLDRSLAGDREWTNAVASTSYRLRVSEVLRREPA